MQAPQQVFKDIESPLKYQTRCITCFPDSTGYMVGHCVFVQRSHQKPTEHGRGRAAGLLVYAPQCRRALTCLLLEADGLHCVNQVSFLWCKWGPLRPGWQLRCCLCNGTWAPGKPG